MGIIDDMLRERLPGYPLWWESLPDDLFLRLKDEWHRNTSRDILKKSTQNEHGERQ